MGMMAGMGGMGQMGTTNLFYYILSNITFQIGFLTTNWI